MNNADIRHRPPWSTAVDLVEQILADPGDDDTAGDVAVRIVTALMAAGWRPTAARPAPTWRPDPRRRADTATARAALEQMRAQLNREDPNR